MFSVVQEESGLRIMDDSFRWFHLLVVCRIVIEEIMFLAASLRFAIVYPIQYDTVD